MEENSEQSSSLSKGHCPKCGPDRFADIAGQHKAVDGDENVTLVTFHRILVCRGCETPFFQTESYFSEDIGHRYAPDGSEEMYLIPEIQYFPSPIKRVRPDWILDLELYDFSLGSLVKDIYGCLDASLSVPAAIATRTAFDRATELLQINPEMSFEKKLDALVNLGKISLDERDILQVLIDAGSAAAHRGWAPKTQELNTLITFLESFLHRTFVLGEAARKLKSVVPSRPARPPSKKPNP